MQQNPSGRASTKATTFSRETSIQIEIHAPASRVWDLITNAAEYPRWNSTVISISGRIALGQKIKLKSVLDPKRVFTLKVKEFVAPRRLVWGDGQGNRVYTIDDHNNGVVTFSMIEKIGGLMFPLYAKLIPPFDESFEKFAKDLKIAAEKK